MIVPRALTSCLAFALAGLALGALPACGAESGAERGAGTGTGTGADPDTGADPGTAAETDDGSGPRLLQPGDVAVVDSDAGPAGDDGERRGVVFVFPGEAGLGAAPRLRLEDPRWLDPVDLAFLAEGTALLLESRWSPLAADGGGAGAGGGTAAGAGGEARGALFALPAREGGRARLLWSDPRLRQPVSLAVTADGRVHVADRSADPLGLGRPTGCVFTVDLEAAAAGAADAARVEAAGPELVTPGALLAVSDGRLLLMDADANPRGLVAESGPPPTPGELFAIGGVGLESVLQPDQTVSPVGLIEDPDGTLWLVDANEGRADPAAPERLGRGALFRIDVAGLVKVIDAADAPPRLLVDPTGGEALPDGRLMVADANADPDGQGEDGTGRGVHGTGPGCVLLLDPRAEGPDRVRPWITHEGFVTPLKVRTVPGP